MLKEHYHLYHLSIPFMGYLNFEINDAWIYDNFQFPLWDTAFALAPILLNLLAFNSLYGILSNKVI